MSKKIGMVVRRNSVSGINAIFKKSPTISGMNMDLWVPRLNHICLTSDPMLLLMSPYVCKTFNLLFSENFSNCIEGCLMKVMAHLKNLFQASISKFDSYEKKSRMVWANWHKAFIMTWFCSMIIVFQSDGKTLCLTKSSKSSRTSKRKSTKSERPESSAMSKCSMNWL